MVLPARHRGLRRLCTWVLAVEPSRSGWRGLVVWRLKCEASRCRCFDFLSDWKGENIIDEYQKHVNKMIRNPDNYYPIFLLKAFTVATSFLKLNEDSYTSLDAVDGTRDDHGFL